MGIQKDQYLIDGILQEKGSILREIYSEFFPQISSFICFNGGNKEDAKDIFQDAIIVIFLKARKSPGFLSVSFKTFLFSICKYLWYNHLKRISLFENTQFNNAEEYEYLQSSALDELIQMEKQKLVYRYFMELGRECQLLLTLFIDSTPIEVISEKMGHSSLQYTRNRKLHCKNLLVRKIRNSPEYKELRNEQVRENTTIS